jgi:hypothetical protein
MTRRTDFTTDQWLTLLDAGPAIARAVANVAGSPGQTEDELEAFVDIVQDAASSETGDTLLGDLVTELSQRLATGSVPPPGSDVFYEGIETARRAGAILSVVAEPVHAEAIRDWLMRVAHQVAASAREGGILGLGGEDVSRPEVDAISEIAYALGAESKPEES